MALSKKKKRIFALVAIVLVGGGGLAWAYMKGKLTFIFPKKVDKDGNVMTIADTPNNGTSNVFLNGVLASGWIRPGSIKVNGSGYWQGRGAGVGDWQFKEGEWEKIPGSV